VVEHRHGRDEVERAGRERGCQDVLLDELDVRRGGVPARAFEARRVDVDPHGQVRDLRELREQVSVAAADVERSIHARRRAHEQHVVVAGIVVEGFGFITQRTGKANPI
jgi:hypothetical protein